ncbi:hypothetical protein BV25DRAFT_1825407 [Artomyces pyxidatus]|uniref:Uncharacterized protein n=1 Tax=Artomyces pyxidatus TaxID=48021 RepID=A0ACB8T1S2_9AGAM|nr:hypothetical protein BV25DRAFT_1825407 [Artomyces pyxidatus]
MRRDWQRTVAARIHLRASTSVREPSAALVRRKAGQIKTKAMSFDAKLIRVAFDDGEERLQVLGMRCVSYDVEIQQKIMEAMLQE